MDIKKLECFVGTTHIEEVKLMLNESGELPENIKLKNPRITLLLSVFLGMLGIDRLYQRGFKIFLYKLAMLVFTLGTWWIADIGYSVPFTREDNYEKIMSACGSALTH